LRSEAQGEAGPVVVGVEAKPQGEYSEGRKNAPLGGSYPKTRKLPAKRRLNAAIRVFLKKDMGLLPMMTISYLDRYHVFPKKTKRLWDSLIYRQESTRNLLAY
jgi:hypothetical protein